MRVCVVGGTGNISTSTVKLLLELGHEVTCFNRGQRGGAPEGARVIVGDRLERDRFEETMQQEAFDAAIDVICYNREDALSDVRAFCGVGHFIQVSTVCTYGVDYDWFPVTVDHPLRPITEYGSNKVAADEVFLEAFKQEQFPATVVKPSTTYGPQMGILRQIAWDFSWINRVVEGRPILICGDGHAFHQHLHVDDAALCFAHMLGRTKCIGQTYNMVPEGFTPWRRYHETAMKVLGSTVEMVGLSCDDLERFEVPTVRICRNIFSHNGYYDAQQLFADVPEFRPRISLEEGMRRVFESMREEDKIPPSEPGGWEDTIIARVESMRSQGAAS